MFWQARSWQHSNVTMLLFQLTIQIKNWCDLIMSPWHTAANQKKSHCTNEARVWLKWSRWICPLIWKVSQSMRRWGLLSATDPFIKMTSRLWVKAACLCMRGSSMQSMMSEKSYFPVQWNNGNKNIKKTKLLVSKEDCSILNNDSIIWVCKCGYYWSKTIIC